MRYWLYIVIIIGSSLIYSCGYDPDLDLNNAEDIEVSNLIYGYDTSNYVFDTILVKPNQFLSDILTQKGYPFRDILKLEKTAEEIFSLRKIRSEKELIFVHSDSCSFPECMIYEPNAYNYVRYHLDDLECVEIIDRPVTKEYDMFGGYVETSLWNALIGNGHSPAVIDKLEDAFASTVDFYHVQRCDSFKFIFEKVFVDGKFIGYGDILAAYFENEAGKHYSVYYENDQYEGFYDLEGRPTKSTFLRSPVRYSRISSRFNRRRFHPIKRRVIPHLGTDYAAPSGTPIRAVANGVVEKASYTKNNGKYVKLKHDRQYKTQYLHMSGFAAGIKSGVKVKQGQTIGYVGQTGLATGPHVCFRFWKNGKQTNHLRENFPPANPMPDTELPIFYQKRDSLIQVLDNLDTIPNYMMEIEKQAT